MDLCNLEARYLNSCRSQEVQPNARVLSTLTQAKLKRSSGEFCDLKITLNWLTDSDFAPLIDALSATKLPGIDAVDVHLESYGVLPKGNDVLALLTAMNEKLRSVSLNAFWKDILCDISKTGLNCQILDIRYSPIRRLNMTGSFKQLHTLNLDFSASLTSIREGCFSRMPNLMYLSMCETQITNIFMTSAALSKLPSLVELRFQNCLCCHDTRSCPKSSRDSSTVVNEEVGESHRYTCDDPSLSAMENSHCQIRRHYREKDFFSDEESFVSHESTQGTTESSEESEPEFTSYPQDRDICFASSPMPAEVNRLKDLKITINQPMGPLCPLDSSSTSMSIHSFGEDLNSLNGDEEMTCTNNTSKLDIVADPGNVLPSGLLIVGESNQQLKDMSQSSGELLMKNEEGNPYFMMNAICSSDHIHKKWTSCHPSPICFEKDYREYMVASLPRLKVLDNVLISDLEREKSSVVFNQHYEHLPYNRHPQESIVSVLCKREMGTNFQSSNVKQLYPPRSSIQYLSRSLSATKVGLNPWPRAKSVSKFKNIMNEENKGFRPRQFEYHPSDPSLMVFGTLDGELVVINHESGKLVAHLPTAGAFKSILGLCWLKKYPSKLIAGCDKGSLQLYDIHQMPTTITDRHCSTSAVSCSFDDFEHLTSVHVNSTDECFLTSGFSNHVALYDINSGKRLQVFKDLHQEHINVVKFSNHSPSVFATASFDRQVKLWDLRHGASQPCYTALSSRGNVMVCFSHDDQYLLSSAVDNEVKQLLAVDGRLHMSFKISSTGSAHNYTRSYYMNGRDYVISGSCEENVVRLCCAQTGRRLKDIPLEGRGPKNSVFVQSLRGDPFRDFHMSVLTAYLRPSSKSEILTVNLVESSNHAKEYSCVEVWEPSHGMDR